MSIAVKFFWNDNTPNPYLWDDRRLVAEVAHACERYGFIKSTCETSSEALSAPERERMEYYLSALYAQLARAKPPYFPGQVVEAKDKQTTPISIQKEKFEPREIKGKYIVDRLFYVHSDRSWIVNFSQVDESVAMRLVDGSGMDPVTEDDASWIRLWFSTDDFLITVKDKAETSA